MPKKQFRVKGVRNALAQTLLANIRTGHERITRLGVADNGQQLLIKTDRQPEYIAIGVAPAEELDFVANLRTGFFGVEAKVVGGGVELRTCTVPPHSLGRYASAALVPARYDQKIANRELEVVPLTHGLDLTFITS